MWLIEDALGVGQVMDVVVVTSARLDVCVFVIFLLMIRRPPGATLFPSPTLFRSHGIFDHERHPHIAMASWDMKTFVQVHRASPKELWKSMKRVLGKDYKKSAESEIGRAHV